MTAPDVFDGGEARIIDRGYRAYDGHRTGVRGAMRSVIKSSVQRALGLRRSVWAKLLPIVIVVMAYVPAIVFIGVLALLPADNTKDLILPTYGEYYGFVIAAIMIFVALVAPEVLCTDRRTGMLGVYLSSPLDRDTYLAAKAASIALVLSLVCLGPPMLMLIANILQNQGPDGVVDALTTLWRVLVTGLALTAMFTGVTMGVTSLTDRKAVGAAGIILLFLVSLTVAQSLQDGSGSDTAQLLSVTSIGLELPQRIHNEYSPIMTDLSDGAVWLGWAVWTFGGLALARFRLRALPVTR